MKTSICAGCLRDFPLDEFGKGHHGSVGRGQFCTTCRSSRATTKGVVSRTVRKAESVPTLLKLDGKDAVKPLTEAEKSEIFQAVFENPRF